MLSLPRVWIQSLIGELRSYKLCSMTQPKHTHTHTHTHGSQHSYTVGQHINYVDLFGEQLVKNVFKISMPLDHIITFLRIWS